MSPILITNCSSRKSGSVDDRLTAYDIPKGSISDVANIWIRKLKQHKLHETVEYLYQGRGAQEAKKCAKTLKAEHWIVSAGLGLVQSNEKVPIYDLTVTGKDKSNIKYKISDGDFTLQRWWYELSKRHRPKRSISNLIKSTRRIVILVMSSNYFNMISEDLSTLSDTNLKRLRIIGPTKSMISRDFHDYLLPYDQRLDGPNSPIPGTKSDFPQRAGYHFSEHIWPKSRTHTLDSHIKLVSKAMSKLSHPVVPKRLQKTDEELISIIIKLWNESGGKSGRMLRILRDQKQFACEQKRFRYLFDQAKHKVGNN